MSTESTPTIDPAHKLITEQFLEYTSLLIVDVEKQGHDNSTYSLGGHISFVANSRRLRFKGAKRARAIACVSKPFEH
jgi:hypothetical protein